MTQRPDRRPTLGASVEPGGVRFAVWAPKVERVDVQLHRRSGVVHHPLTPVGDGLHEGFVAKVGAGARYKFRLDGGDAFPDPYSRFQPEDVHGPSEVSDPTRFRWHDDDWEGVDRDGLVIYECHVGTMTPEGTFAALTGQLAALKRLGVTAIELMPVADFPGRWNWGYDGVNPFAPSRAYGRPDDLRRLVDAAHRHGLGVILDVVYNHLGPDGNYLRCYSDDYFTDRHQTPWGDAFNYDGPNNRRVRDYAIDNACRWLTEYHVDGLRLDATHAIVDDSPTHLLAELAARARSTTPRRVVIIAEDGRNDVRLIRDPDEGGYGLDGVWADDFHHAVRVFLTGEREAYFQDFAGTTAEIARAVNEGFVFQGQYSSRRGRSRGTPVTDEPAASFLFCIQNHDQVGNRATGERLHHQIDVATYHAASALLLLVPETPLLFMGQEFRASSPFLFFTDHHPELGKLVTEGRREEFKGFAAFQDPARRKEIPDPQAESTFLRSKLDLGERRANAGTLRLYRDLLRLRLTDPILTIQDRRLTHAEPLGRHLLAIHRWDESNRHHRLFLANFGPDVSLRLVEESFLSWLLAAEWRLLLSTSLRRYGGTGERVALRGPHDDRRIRLPAHTAALFAVDQQR
jgi:maltooligosyltrehalose trehalohydrolase